MKNNIKMSDIANKLGVSVVTVSKALNGKDGVSDELRIKIQDTAEEIGYKFSSLSKAFRTGKQNNVGILISEKYLHDNSFYWNLYQNLQRKLSRENYFGILEICSREDEKKQIIPKIVSEGKVDCIVVIGQMKKKYLLNLLSEFNDLVFLDFFEPDINVDSIVVDNFYGSYTVTKYLIDMGHRDIAFLGNIFSTSSIMDRGMGFYKCMLENKCNLKMQWYISDRNEDGEFCDFILPSPLPTAFVCNSDQTAYNLYSTLQKNNISVPEQVSIVGFDNYYAGDKLVVPLTTVDVGREKFVESCINVIKKVFSSKERNCERILLDYKLVEKSSVKKTN